ncbi:hypothetical protein [Agrobacterium larrymoorei]|uniref:hypothetical protein n=1 Tax=Agrobacterium larrymoorei TaxID=160699 RepID=UPI0030BEEB56
MKLGKRQLETLLSVGCTSAMIVPTPITKRLCEIGLMKSHGPDGSFASITTDGLRALADAVDAGSIQLFVMPERRAVLERSEG